MLFGSCHDAFLRGPITRMLNARLSSPLTVSQVASLLYKDSFTLIFCYSGCAGQTFVAVIKNIQEII